MAEKVQNVRIVGRKSVAYKQIESGIGSAISGIERLFIMGAGTAELQEELQTLLTFKQHAGQQFNAAVHQSVGK